MPEVSIKSIVIVNVFTFIGLRVLNSLTNTHIHDIHVLKMTTKHILSTVFRNDCLITHSRFEPQRKT